MPRGLSLMTSDAAKLSVDGLIDSIRYDLRAALLT